MEDIAEPISKRVPCSEGPPLPAELRPRDKDSILDPKERTLQTSGTTRSRLVVAAFADEAVESAW